jgi:hypothetical protein
MDPNVAWFDIDLLDHNIIINSGSFYVGARQLELDKCNQIGFDMEGASYVSYARSYGYLPSEGWFNLDDYCRYCELNPLVCELYCSLFPEDDICTGMYCGNLMIRAMVSEPETYSGDLPQEIGPAILYTTDDHPRPCTNPDMDPGQSCQATINVHAVGPAGEYTGFYALAANNYSADYDGPIKVTITPPATPCDAANLDAVYPVDYGDIRALASQWLESTPPLFADINGDGDTNIKDFAKIAEYWLQSCD